MRYDDWDVLIFPSGNETKVPLKEFKVQCHVVPDPEFSHTHGSLSVPVMTCFVPGLRPGTPFHVSIHSWDAPTVSQYTLNYSKHSELVKFETRIFVDGRLVSYVTVPVAPTVLYPEPWLTSIPFRSTSFDRKGAWPHLINSSFGKLCHNKAWFLLTRDGRVECTKNGELAPLRFPTFRRELLYQNHWNPDDDIGRVKIVISEGFPRDSLSMPIERVKNVVAFSFQHAPLGIVLCLPRSGMLP
jgi:hypothetical protein